VLFRSTAPGTLAAQWQAVGMAAGDRLRCREQIKASIGAAVAAALHELVASSSGSTAGHVAPVICITGSLHMVAAALHSLPRLVPPAA
jgi:hypothetical protein